MPAENDGTDAFGSPAYFPGSKLGARLRSGCDSMRAIHLLAVSMTPAELHKYRSDAVPLIQTHLWLGKEPPRSVDKRPWSMARELSIWNLLVKANFKPEHINGAIAVTRKLRPDWDGEKLRLTIFYWSRQGGVFTATPFLEQCIGYHLSRVGRESRERRRLDVAPTVGDVLRRALG